MSRLRPFPGRVNGRLQGAVIVIAALASRLHAQDVKSADWHEVAIPDAWRSVPKDELAPIDGYSWYRCAVQVPESWEGAELLVFFEALDDARAAYFNGVKVAATGTFPPQFRSGLGENGRVTLDPESVRFGDENFLALRVYQSDPRPYFSVAAPILLNQSQMEAIRMAGPWQYRPGDDPDWSMPADKSAGDEPTAFAKVDPVDDIDRYLLHREGDHDPLPPSEAEASFEVPDDVDFQLVLSEPDVSQPLFMTWDAKGRLWVVEYRQYPEVAGLKVLSRDVHLRTVYDKVPPPPPNHERGRDRISIHEDINGDGVYDRHKTFLNGLNLATSCAIGRGGVWVTNPPYLLFYPDRNGDDVPDGDPEVHLEGFGLEDSHSVINSLRFGPDGWLYAAQGSTVSAAVQRPGSDAPPVHTMGQNIWRYHPEQRRYEVFAEGGGNTFGVEIDKKGRVFSGHNGGDTRGFHYVQGGYYRKGFDKHGELSNPYAFGYFGPIKHHSVPRFTHNFVIYDDHVLPEAYQGNLFGIEPLQGQVVMSSIEPFQSSFQTADLSRPVKTEDQWFRPVDIKVGPDGCIYVADMYEQDIAHSSHYAGRIDRTNGRIYRLKPRGELQETDSIDYRRLSSEELVRLLDHPLRWHRQTAIRLLGDRRDEGLVKSLIGRLNDAEGQLALELLWALHASGGLSDQVAAEQLRHSDPFVRAWTVRLICDSPPISPDFAAALADLASTEPDIHVRKQLASSAKRLSTENAMPVLRRLLVHDDDAKDLHQPLLLWWTLEAHLGEQGEGSIAQSLLSDADVWQRPLVRDHLIARLMKRYALSGARADLHSAAKLLNAAPDQPTRDILLEAFEEAYQGRSLAGIPKELVDAIANAGGGSLALRLRQQEPEAVQQAIEVVLDPQSDPVDGRQIIQIFGELRGPEFLPVLLEVVQTNADDGLVTAALTALQSYSQPGIGAKIVQELSQMQGDTREVAESLLASRLPWAKQLLLAVDNGTLKAGDISEAALRKILLHHDEQVRSLVTRHWGDVAGATTQQMRETIDQLAEVIHTGSGNPKQGRPLFMERCGKCHTLFDDGGNVGPNLTPYQRDDLQRVLLNVVNPSAEIREGFENHVVITGDGRVVNGFVGDQDQQVVVLRTADGQNLVIRRDEIEQMQRLPRSVMPEETLKDLTDQQIRDLFAFFRSSQPVH